MHLWTVSRFSEEERNNITVWAYSVYGEELPRKILIVFRGCSLNGIEFGVNGEPGTRCRTGGSKDYPGLIEQTEGNVGVFVIWRDEQTATPVYGVLIDDYALEGTTFDGTLIVHDGMFLKKYNIPSRKVESTAMASKPRLFAGRYIAGWIPWSRLASSTLI